MSRNCMYMKELLGVTLFKQKESCIHKVKIYLMYAFLFAAAKSGTEEAESEKAIAYLQCKWRLWHKALDINHDKLISCEDVEQMKLYNAYRDIPDHVGSTLERLFREIILGGYSSLSSDEFAEMVKIKYESNQTSFVQTMKKLNLEWVETLDFDENKYLSEEEYETDWLAFRHDNTLRADEIFVIHILDERLISLDEAQDFLLRFETETDKSKFDIILVAMDSGF